MGKVEIGASGYRQSCFVKRFRCKPRSSTHHDFCRTNAKTRPRIAIQVAITMHIRTRVTIFSECLLAVTRCVNGCLS